MVGSDSASPVLDSERLEIEQRNYQELMDEKINQAYNVAKEAKSKGLDFSTKIEIPRAADLASRTEKLLEDPYLFPDIEDRSKGPLQIEELLRDLIKTHDRETAAILISQHVTKEMYSKSGDKRRSVDSGLRVGLAVLTEAVLVAPLDGIGDVRIMNNADGSDFLSIDFCGPIRAAGGTAQAMGVLIGDILRREMGVGRYLPSFQEVERVKEEFGLYRAGLQYKPPPEETEIIVNACPVMINGEETERMECAGYKEVRNIVNENGTFRTRVRGGVMLVIGEGLCLKAPKIRTHTERLKVPGWEFISRFAEKGSSEKSMDSELKRRAVSKNERYMGDVIAGRPIFGDPREPGGFRLRYGRSRATGLAAAGLNPVTMEAMGGFLSVGTQMKIEGPGKACAVTPCVEIDGPMVLLRDGSFVMVRSLGEWEEVSKEVISIWDSGEVLIGFGEFLENNKSLVPSSYSVDWWAADVSQALDSHRKLEWFAGTMGVAMEDLPPGLPFNGAIERGGENPIDRSLRHRGWIDFLRRLDVSWEQLGAISETLGTAVPPPWNLWWSDLPLHFLPDIIDSLLKNGLIEGGILRIRRAVLDWPIEESENIFKSSSEGDHFSPGWTRVEEHGIVKSGLMTLGLEHHHEGKDIVVPRFWEGLLDGLGLEIFEGSIRIAFDANKLIKELIGRVEDAYSIVDSEEVASDQIGRRKAIAMLDDHDVERSLMVVRRISRLRWEDAVPCRVGARMGRPEKSGIREMKPLVHAIYPIGENGGPQRLMSEASKRGTIRVTVGIRICEICGGESPHISCHHRPDRSNPSECGGRTVESVRQRNSKSRRRGEMTTLELDKILEVKRRNLGLEKLPGKIKAVKGMMSVSQSPEPLEKGILRARNGISVFRDGTSRYDMSDVPVTHFRPSEIGTDWKKLVLLGYTHDCRGVELASNEQIIELLPQDLIPSIRASEHLLSICKYVDELLDKFYGMNPFYDANSPDDLVGHMAIGLAPHTSGGVACRIIGWTRASAGYAHPLFHAAKRRNCDGDEDSIMMMMDGLLNFTQSILPANRGGRMDAPIVLTTRLNPSEIDKEALNVDCSWSYSRDFYEATLTQPHSSDLTDIIDIVGSRLGSIGDLRGYGWTHDSGPLDAGPSNSSYKTLVKMEDKLEGQLSLGGLLRSVKVEGVARQVIESHFLPDMRGNLMAFTRQKVRCVKCGASYRRMPLAGKCIEKGKSSSFRGFDNENGSSMCGGNVVLTVSEGAVRKYIGITQRILDDYGVDDYTRHRVGWMASSTDSLFNNDRVTVMTLEDFF